MSLRVSLVLVHHPVLDCAGTVVATAVTPLDLHDLARLARTYGLNRLYATTPVDAQRTLLTRLLDHWVSGAGGVRNPSRRQALERVDLVRDFAEVRRREAVDGPALVVGTSARAEPGRVTFGEARRRIEGWCGRTLVVFGTGWGLTGAVLAGCDLVVEPVEGPGDYNHLSVRSAASIVVDRLFGAPCAVSEDNERMSPQGEPS